MDIEITGILDTESKLVAFTSPAGRASGVWRDESTPELCKSAVEFEVPDEVHSWALASSQHHELTREQAASGGGVTVTGTVETIGDDSVVALRVYSDILLVEIPKASRAVKPGDSLTFTVPVLEIYPYHP